MKILLSLSLLFLLNLPLFSQDAEAEAIVKKIVDKYIEGVDVESIKSYKISVMMMDVMQGTEMDMILYFKRPHFYRAEIVLETTGQKSISTYNGKEGWTVSNLGPKPVTEELDKDNIKQLIEQVDILEHDLANYKQKGIEIIYLTDDVIDEKDVAKLKVKEKGKDRTIYVDEEEGVILKRETTLERQGQQIPIDYYNKNYSRENGILLPHAIEMKYQGQAVMIFVFENFEFNIDIEDSFFNKPSL